MGEFSFVLLSFVLQSESVQACQHWESRAQNFVPVSMTNAGTKEVVERVRESYASYTASLAVLAGLFAVISFSLLICPTQNWESKTKPVVWAKRRRKRIRQS